MTLNKIIAKAVIFRRPLAAVIDRLWLDMRTFFLVPGESGPSCWPAQSGLVRSIYERFSIGLTPISALLPPIVAAPPAAPNRFNQSTASV